MRIIDLSRELYHRTPSYPGQPPIIHGVWKTHEEAFAESGNVQGNSVMYFSMPDHGGTHIDAPRHFGKSGTPIDEYPLENCIVPGICIDLRHVAPRAEITPADLEAAVAQTGLAIPQNGTVLLCTGHHARTFPTAAYSTDNPGVNVAATEWLARQGIVHFGIDSMRPGPEGVVNALVHKACLELGITHIESLCNLESADRAGDVPVHRPAAEMARRHRLADPGGGGVRGLGSLSPRTASSAGRTAHRPRHRWRQQRRTAAQDREQSSVHARDRSEFLRRNMPAEPYVPPRRPAGRQERGRRHGGALAHVSGKKSPVA